MLARRYALDLDAVEDDVAERPDGGELRRPQGARVRELRPGDGGGRGQAPTTPSRSRRDKHNTKRGNKGKETASISDSERGPVSPNSSGNHW